MKELVTRLVNWLKKIWWLILAIVGIIGAFLAQKDKDDEWRYIEDDIDRHREEEEQKTEDALERQKERQKRSEKLKERLDKLPHLVIILVLLLVFPVQAAEPVLSDEYDLLLEQYRELSQIAAEYKDLYEEAERDVSALIESNKKLQQLIEEQGKLIEKLLKKERLSLSAGVSLNQTGPGLFSALTYYF